ncbi:MAG: DUF349 domain-containing protein [Duncaniella sp.]|nr:DUF349 domain-containing protein [Duncaniella sp.]
MEQRDPSIEPTEVNETLNLEVAASETTETTPAEPTQGKETSQQALTKEELTAALAEISSRDAAEISNDEVGRLKQQFYALRNEEHRLEREAFIAEGGDVEAFVPATDQAEEAFKGLMTIIKDKKAAYRAAIEAQEQANYDRKKAIIDQLNELSADTDNVNRVFSTVRELQTQFKEIGDVPQTVASDLWRAYQEAVEKFYDQLKINKELRDYDFKKNLAEKETLIAEAEKLRAEEDIIMAFKRLQELQNQWRGIGPVPKDVRDEIWGKFKEISTEVHKRYQDFFVERKAREQENELAKTALCERIEAVDFSGLQTYAAWDAATREFITAQEEWKTLGHASRKMNNALFSRFREACDKFFTAKTDFFKRMKEELSVNLEKKIALCERAEALKESSDWRATADELTALQKEWKTIGAVPKKHSDQVWRRFLDACDYFFDRKKKNSSGTRRTERANLEQKQEIIQKLKSLAEAPAENREDTIKAVKDLQAEWQSVGHVPFNEKDKVYAEYRAVVDSLYEALKMERRGSRMEAFENSISEMQGDSQRLYRERERLLRSYEQRKGELQTYENNMGFLNARSKNADSMLRDMQRRVQRLRDDLADLELKIKAIDSRL